MLNDFGLLVECLQQHLLDLVDMHLLYLLKDVGDVCEQDRRRLGSSLLQSLQLFEVLIYFMIIPCEFLLPGLLVNR